LNGQGKPTRILFVAPAEPIAPDFSGASSRDYQNFAVLTQLYAPLDVLRLGEETAFSRTYTFERRSKSALQAKQQVARWQDVTISAPAALSRPIRWTRSLTDPASLEFKVTPQVLAVLRERIAASAPDLIWVEGTALAAALIKTRASDRWVLSQHDVRSNVMNIRRGSDTLSKRWRQFVSQRAEAQVLAATPLIVTGSSSDAERSKALGAKQVELIHMAYDALLPAPSGKPESLAYIAHLGSLETTANRIGLEAYLRKVQPELSRAGAAVPLWIIGDHSRLKEPLQSLLREAQADLKGFVPDLGQVLRPFNIAILPYEQDSGYRTKLPVLFDHAQVVVTTRAAVQGMWIDGLDRVCVVLDRLEDFPAAILRLIDQPDERERLGRAAHEFYAAHWTLDAVIEQYRRLVDRMVAR